MPLPGRGSAIFIHHSCAPGYPHRRLRRLFPARTFINANGLTAIAFFNRLAGAALAACVSPKSGRADAQHGSHSSAMAFSNVAAHAPSTSRLPRFARILAEQTQIEARPSSSTAVDTTSIPAHGQINATDIP